MVRDWLPGGWRSEAQESRRRRRGPEADRRLRAGFCATFGLPSYVPTSTTGAAAAAGTDDGQGSLELATRHPGGEDPGRRLSSGCWPRGGRHGMGAPCSSHLTILRVSRVSSFPFSVCALACLGVTFGFATRPGRRVWPSALPVEDGVGIGRALYQAPSRGPREESQGREQWDEGREEKKMEDTRTGVAEEGAA